MRQERSGSPPWTCGDLRSKRKSAKKWKLRSSSRNGGTFQSPLVKSRKSRQRSTEQWHPLECICIIKECRDLRVLSDGVRDREAKTWLGKDTFVWIEPSRMPAANREFKLAVNSNGNATNNGYRIIQIYQTLSALSVVTQVHGNAIMEKCLTAWDCKNCRRCSRIRALWGMKIV